MLEQLNDYDWAEVFGEGSGVNCGPITPDAPPGSDVATTTFCRNDVTSILGLELGENDGPDWIVWGQLSDGRFFLARAGSIHDWDCQASNSGNVAATREDIIRFGMNEDERKRFGVTIPGDPHYDNQV